MSHYFFTIQPLIKQKKIILTLSLPKSDMETFKVVLTLESVDKPFGVTIQMQPLQQYFHIVQFVFKYFTK